MIFLSYCWADDQLANKIDKFFSDNGILLTRDRRDLKYKQSIKEFMTSIRDADYVIMVISEKYLKSKNCMYEVLEFIKNRDFKEKIIPVITSESNIFDVLTRIEYQKYWSGKVEELGKSLVGIDVTHAISLITQQKEYKQIESDILDYLATVCDMNNIVVINHCFTDMHFNDIANYIGIEDLSPVKYVVNLELEKDIKLSVEEILDSFQNDYQNFKQLYKKDKRVSFIFYTHKKEENLSYEIQNKFGFRNFKRFSCFKYKDGFYIAGKRKTVEYDWKTIIWWGHLDYGYVDDIRLAGIYSPTDVKRIVLMDSFTIKDQLAISCEYVDNINVPIIPVDSNLSWQLVKDRSKIIGNPNWHDNDGYE